VSAFTFRSRRQCVIGGIDNLAQVGRSRGMTGLRPQKLSQAQKDGPPLAWWADNSKGMFHLVKWLSRRGPGQVF